MPGARPPPFGGWPPGTRPGGCGKPGGVIWGLIGDDADTEGGIMVAGDDTGGDRGRQGGLPAAGPAVARRLAKYLQSDRRNRDQYWIHHHSLNVLGRHVWFRHRATPKSISFVIRQNLY